MESLPPAGANSKMVSFSVWFLTFSIPYADKTLK